MQHAVTQLLLWSYRGLILRNIFIYGTNLTHAQFLVLFFLLRHLTGFTSVITGRKGPMLSHFCAATPALFILWIIMAQVAGQEDREKTTALKGELLLIMITQQ